MKTCSNKDCVIGKPQPLTAFYRGSRLAGNKYVAQCKACLQLKQTRRNARIKAENKALRESIIKERGKQATDEMESILSLAAMQSDLRIEQHFSY